ncbi:MAG: MoaD family protein [Desulfobacterales bacterium]|jgi:MoaD family protein
MMRINVKGFLTLKSVMDAQAVFDYEGDSLTVDDLLRELSIRYGEDFRKMIFDHETHTLSRHIRILINGRHFSHLPGKLNTQLHEGDVVSLFPPIAGG